MSNHEQLRKLYKYYYAEAPNNTLPNYCKIKKATDELYSFIEKVKEKPETLGEDDSVLNAHLSDYLDEYAFAAFCVGMALGKDIERELDFYKTHLKLEE